MTEWSRETSWRQGNALTDETVDKFGLCDPQSPEKTVVVVTPHDCDLAASPDREPDVEMIIGRLIEKADGNFTHAKTPRILHIEFTTQDSAKVIELAATKKIQIQKSNFVDEKPREDLRPDAGGLSILQRWLAARYRRSAFPDAFEKRLNDSRASEKLTKILKPVGKHICAIFFDVDEGKEIQRNDSDDAYTLAIVLLYTSQPDSKESEAVADKAKQEIESTFKDLFFNATKTWREIELVDCMVMSDEALTYAQSTAFKQWRLEHLSLRGNPEDPMMQ
jgi:hypothetical protein